MPALFSGAHAIEVFREILAGDAPVGFAIAGGGLLDDVGWKVGSGRLVIPPGRIQPVPEELLVERWLGMSGLVAIGRPETRGVRREHLVTQDQLTVGEPKLELGVCQDDPPLQGMSRGELVQLERYLLKLLGQASTDQVGRLFEA